MDIHRCRFVLFPPAPINALAFSPPHPTNSRLAVGRDNGDIEIWNPLNGAWLQEKIIHGGLDRSVDGLVWVAEPDQKLSDDKTVPGRLRLFSIGSSSTITEWDLVKGVPKRHATGNHGEIWCLAAQPVPAKKGSKPGSDLSSHHQTTRLIAGTIKGELISYSIEDDTLRFDKVLVRSQAKKHQLLSISFPNRHMAVVGCSDSTIRIYDLRKGMLLKTMSLGSDLAGGSKDIIVWSVKCLPDGDIVSADSTGQICIWDGKTFTLTQRLQSHDSDALSLAVSADASVIVSGGMDKKTIFYKKLTGSGRWGKVWSRRYHDHDVKAMASFASGSKNVVVSGGPDGAPVVLPMKEIGLENHRRLSHLPQQPALAGAVKARFMVSWWNQEIRIWLFRESVDAMRDNVDESELNRNRKLLKKIVVKTESNLSSAVISPDGTFLAASSASGIRAWRLHHNNPTVPKEVGITEIKLPTAFAEVGAAGLTISPDGKWLSIVTEGTLVSIARISLTEDSTGLLPPRKIQRLKRLPRDVPKHKLLGGLGSYNRSITKTCFSPDSRMLATVDLAGFIDTWILRDPSEATENGIESGEDTSSSSDDDSDDDSDVDGQIPNGASQSREKWVRNPAASQLPKLSSTPVVLSFSPDVPRQPMMNGNAENGAVKSHDDYTLLAVTTPFEVLTFNPLQGTLTDWARRNKRAQMPPQVLDIRDSAMGVVWNGPCAFIYGPSFVFKLNITLDTKITPSQSQKRKRATKDHGAGSKMQVGALGPHKVYKFDGASKEPRVLSNDARHDDDEMDISEEDDEDVGLAHRGELQTLREAEGAEESEESPGDGGDRWHLVTKFRPILGIAPIGEEGSKVEVALVERPLWQIDLPVRYGDDKEKTYY
ncbi:related to UTP4 - U3 snoRNP protein [Cephalotrichum gorgonifer]|uniref:Related to UTP4 - U3 snoRNP protein n=1 Tax=Cephalotrichum gorgonifer TaxID=2041049 RepID=A0AAE8MYN4_9PEZI|nr:related to UTP4 - U3 snoRNP protein [Cephalotrichum gorgonifer]